MGTGGAEGHWQGRPAILLPLREEAVNGGLRVYRSGGGGDRRKKQGGWENGRQERGHGEERVGFLQRIRSSADDAMLQG